MESGNYFLNLLKFAEIYSLSGPIPGKEKVPPETTIEEFLNRELDLATTRPWKSMEHPFLLEWIKKNELPLNLVFRASQKKYYFFPKRLYTQKGIFGGHLLDTPDDPEPLIVEFDSLSLLETKDLIRALTARAMWRAGEGDFEGAWEDILTCRRMALLISHSCSLMDLLVGISLDTQAHEAALGLLQVQSIPASCYKKMIKDLQALPKGDSLNQIYDKSERYLCLSFIMKFNSSGMESALQISKSMGIFDKIDIPAITEFGKIWVSGRQKKAMGNIGWDPILIHANEWYDKLVTILSNTSRKSKIAALKTIELERKAMTPLSKIALNEWIEYLYNNKTNSKWDIQKSAFNFCLELLPEKTMPLLLASERNEQNWNNFTVALALEAFRKEKGRYPPKISELAPDFLSEIPQDLFVGMSLTYRIKGKGYVLYSLGANELDDGGKMQRSGEHEGDVGIEFPFPASLPAAAPPKEKKSDSLPP